MEETLPPPGPSLDMSKFLAETKREALTVLYPQPEELAARIALITRMTGKAPEITKVYKAAVLFELRQAIIQRRSMNWDTLEPSVWLMKHAPSLQGKGRQEAVEIARAQPIVEGRKSWFERVTGR